MKEEIKNILAGVKNGDRVLEYIEKLEEFVQIHSGGCECNCHGEDEHNHQECGCGCHDDEEESEWVEIKIPYSSSLTVKDWEKLIKNSEIFTLDSLKVIKRMRHIAAPTTSMELADTFGLGAMYYRMECQKLEERLLAYVKADNLKPDERWGIIFDGWKNRHSGEEIYALLPELYEAIGNVDLSRVALREGEV